MTDAELADLMVNLESDRVERKETAGDGNAIRQAICAFANDLPNHNKPGVIFLGVKDDGTCGSLPITDQLLRTLADMRSDGNIQPIPTISVQPRKVNGCDVAVLVVQPADAPPVRYKGRVWIRVGPRRASASAEEERRLSEKRRWRDLPYDLHPVSSSTVDDFSIEVFRQSYLPSAVAPDVLAANNRTLEQQLSSVRFTVGPETPTPTVLGLLTIGKTPSSFIPGAYVQFLRIDGSTLSDPILDQKDCRGPLLDLLRQLDEIVRNNIRTATDVTSASTEMRYPDYPARALQQLLRNAVMHRNYESSNAPVRINWFSDRVEIQNPGGPFGQVTAENFGRPGLTDYRNPNLAEALRNLGFVQRFGVGIQIARRALEENGNPGLEFDVQQSHILAVVRRRQ